MAPAGIASGSRTRLLCSLFTESTRTACKIPGVVGAFVQPLARTDEVREGRLPVSTLSYSAIMSDRALVGRQPDLSKELRTRFEVRDLCFWYGKSQALFDITLAIPEKSVLALIGPSGCGKSTFLRCLNRMNDLIEGTHHTGAILMDDQDIYRRGIDQVDLRRRVGMVFQKSNPFPKSLFENVVFGPRVAGVRNRAVLQEIC